MRQGQQHQQKRMRGRNNNRKGSNQLNRSYESNGPDVKIRGTASHIADKYVQLARDAQSSGDPVAAENYLQHAEHYYRIVMANQPQFPQNQGQPGFMRADDERDDEGDDEGGERPVNGYDHDQRPPQGYPQNAPQPYVQAEGAPQPREQREPRGEPRAPAAEPAGGLPAFITGGEGTGDARGDGHGRRNNRNRRFGRYGRVNGEQGAEGAAPGSEPEVAPGE